MLGALISWYNNSKIEYILYSQIRLNYQLKYYKQKSKRFSLKWLCLVAASMQEEGGVTALDFYTIDKSTFFSMLGFVATYLVILLQSSPSAAAVARVDQELANSTKV